jgi:RHS repeat-associated protein
VAAERQILSKDSPTIAEESAMPRRVSLSLRLAAIVLPIIILSRAPILAIDENLTKGATNNHIFESGVWGENIDLLNGGLNLTIPIGPAYGVSTDVSYQLKLSYSSKIWRLEGAEPHSYNGNQRQWGRSRLQGFGQAGLGFALQMGRYLKRANSVECVLNDYPSDSRLTEEGFEDATGAFHALGGNWRGTPDGSYLKVTTSEVRMPGGTRYELGHVVGDLRANTDPNWPRCTFVYPPPSGNNKALFDIWTNDYRGNYVSQIKGKNTANYALIEYETTAGMQHLMKKITNYRGGVAEDPNRAITFVNTMAHPDPNHASDPNWSLKMGYVQSVTLPVFSNNSSVVRTAIYTFNYKVEDVWDPYVGSSDPDDAYNAQDNPDDKFEQVLLLTSITFPEGYTMNFGYTGAGWQGHNIGYLQSRVLPTGAKIVYEYQTYAFRPEKCEPGQSVPCLPIGDCGPPTFSAATCSADPDPAGWTHGIAAKTVMPDPNNPAAPTYSWTYEREAHAVGRPNPAAVVTTDPFGNDTVTYFHADSYDTYHSYSCGNNPPATCYTYHNNIWKNGTSYRTEYYRGSSADPGNLVRTEYQTWVDDITDPNSITNHKHTGNYRRVVESGTIYNDDGGKTIKTVNDEWDGLGNFRKVTDFGFDGVAYRIRRSDYNNVSDTNSSCPGLSEAHCDNWILGTNTYSETLDPAGSILQRSEYAFDALGYLKTRKDLLTLPTTAGAELAVGDPNTGNAGDIRTESKYEGDITCPAGAASYATGNVCYKKVTDFGATSGVFEESYTYQHVTVGSQEYVLPYLATRKVGAFNWKAEDREVDASTGLTRFTKDPNGVKTTFDYDTLGRLTTVTPDSIADPNGPTELAASLAYPDIWTTTLEQAISTSDKIYSKFSFDTLGRLIRIDKRQADGILATQKTQFDIAGRVTWQCEWGDPNTAVGDPNRGTTFDYTDPFSGPGAPAIDPFGRVRKTIAADGTVTRTNYAGVSSTVTVEGVQAGYSPVELINPTTFYDKDAFGRLTRVLAPRTYPNSTTVCAYNSDGVDAYYSYDRLDRLGTVRLETMTDPNNPACPTSSQYRGFSYNALGQQISATNPENGTVTNLMYDTAGNLLKRQDGKGNVFFYQYDAASRLLNGWLDKADSDPNRLMLANTYDQASGSFGYGLGKLTTSLSYDDAEQAVVREESRYTGMNGRLRETSRKYGRWDPAVSSITSQAELVMRYEYNALGLLKKLTYPEKSSLARTVLSPDFTYANGYLTAVSDPNRGVLVDSISYNLAGGVRKIKTRGDVETDIPVDARNRPASITVTKLGTTPVTHFASGNYTYDGAGNITAIGQDKFAYDALNRLALAYLVDPAVSGKTETLTWQYDSLGNMTKQEKTTGPSGGVTTNKFTMNAKNQIQSYEVLRNPGTPDPNVATEYDGNGNLTLDRNYEYVFDARNRLTEVHKKSDGALVAKYAYDASGYRISKYEAATQMTTWYLRDAAGQTLSEFRRPNKPGTPSWLKDYVYAAGRHVAMVENEVPSVPAGIEIDPSGVNETPNVSMTWAANPELDIAGYLGERICVSVLCEDTEPFEFDVSSPQYNDSDVVEGWDYTYRLAAYDTAGRTSEYSDTLRVAVGYNPAPQAPTAVSAVAGDGQVTVSWSGPNNSDLYGYRIYRKPSSGSTWVTVGPLLRKPQTSFTDTTAVNNQEYDYQVKAVDTAELESTGVPATPTWRRTPQDLAAPDAPTGLTGLSADTSVQLNWHASTALDLSAYKLYRSTAPIVTADPNLQITQTASTSFNDPNLATNQRYYYRVSAVDTVSPTPNQSVLSDQLEILTKASPSTLPVPAISSTQAPQWGWAYCLSSDLALYTDICHLPATQSHICYWEDDPNVPGDDRIFECPPWTHENSRNVSFTWDPASTGADLVSLRLYGRRSAGEPWQLWSEYPEPWFKWMRMDTIGLAYKMYDHYPLAVVDPNIPSVLFRYQDHAFNPEDACQDVTFRVSAVATVGGVQRESVLSTEEVTVPKAVPAPENLQVAAEPIDTESCTNCKRLNSQFYGMTLSWSAGGSTCASTFKGYNVYRSRHGIGTSAYSATPIRLTRQPIGMPVMRVDYLPLAGPASWDHDGLYLTKAFDGPMGIAGLYGGEENGFGDRCAKKYRVTAVDGSGQQSAMSNQVLAHTEDPGATDNEYRNQPCLNGASSGPINTENSCELATLSLPDPNDVLQPGPVVTPSWTWRFGRDLDPNGRGSDVGPGAGNWALVKWTLPTVDTTHGAANDFRLLRKRAGETSYSEVMLDLIPGDDAGIRQFVWAMPLELACEDANYAVQGFDLYDRAGQTAYLSQTVSKYKLVPENVTLTGVGTSSLKTTWDPLPSCQAGSSSHYVSSYTVMVSQASCSGSAPAAGTFTTHVSQSAGGANEVTFDPNTQTLPYWYALRADWSDGSSALSPPVCRTGGGQSQNLPGLGGAPEEAGWEVARLMSSEESEATDPRGMPNLRRSILGGAASPHRVVGQSGGVNPAVALYFYHVDHLGTPRVITDVNGNAVSKHKYLPYGEELSPPPSTNTHEFNGHEQDAETGLTYMKARYFSPAGTFRFASPDPGNDTHANWPQSFNRYAYVRNNPVGNGDPDGREVTFLPGQDMNRIQASVLELVALSPLMETEYIAHLGSWGGPDLTIGSDPWMAEEGITDSNISPSGEYLNSKIMINPDKNTWTIDLEKTILEEFGHTNDFRTNTAQVQKEQPPDGTGSTAGTERRSRQWSGAAKKEVNASRGRRQDKDKPPPKVHKQKGTAEPGFVASGLEAQGMSVSYDGGSSNSDLQRGRLSVSVLENSRVGSR